MSIESNTITTLANWIGFNLYNIFKFFENLAWGYVLMLMLITIVFFIIYYFKFIKKGMVKVAP